MDTASVINAITASASAIAAIAGGTSAYVALKAIRKGEIDRKNQQLLERAVRNLERAYKALVNTEFMAPQPKPGRLEWLTAARLIEDYRATKGRITDQVTIDECESHEEHWRHLFYQVLEPINRKDSTFFTINMKGNQPIDHVSAIIIHSFASWPKGKKDPIDVYPSKAEAIDKLGVDRIWLALMLQLNLIR